MNENDNKDANAPVITDVGVEEQIARNMVELLDGHAQQLPDMHAHRLADARSLAIGRLVSNEARLVSRHQLQQNGQALQWMGSGWRHYVGQHRTFATLVFVSVMLFTFFTVQQINVSYQIENSDAFLLAADLPPEAYADKGFSAWLGSN